MKERYPFFQDEDEETKAVIGEDVIDADLNGAFEKPYAVLTQKRFYAKDWRGNFIVEIGDLTETTTKTKDLSNSSRLLISTAVVTMVGLLFDFWIVSQLLHQFSPSQLIQAIPATMKLNPIAGLSLLSIFGLPVCFIGLLGFAFFRKKDEKKALICVIVSTVSILSLLGIVFIILYFFSKRNSNLLFSVVHTGGEFTFVSKDYPEEELKNFEAQVKELKAGVAGGK